MLGIEKLKSCYILKITPYQLTNRNFKTLVFHKENSWKDRNVLGQMENTWLLLILELVNPLLYTEELFSCITVTSILVNFMKSKAHHRVQLSPMKMINGLQKLMRNGSHKKMLRWKTIYKKSLVVEESHLKNNF